MSGTIPPTQKKVRVLCVAGARPNFMKIAPLLRELFNKALIAAP